jgi:sodium-dependent dicarboxylate transporter 2/3/5
LPSREKGKFILEWNDVKRLPFHIILLFGGGFALAKGIEVSGLGDYLASRLQFFKDYPLWMLIAALALIITLLSELASNVATITLMLPILASLAEAINVDPIKLMLPATFAASFGFMLVIATAPNTIAYATGYFHSRKLLQAGFWMNLAGIILLTAAMSLLNF